MIRNILGSLLALAGAAAAVFSPFRPWYDGRPGRDFRLDALFQSAGVTGAKAPLLYGLFLPVLVVAVLTVLGVLLRSRPVVALAGLVALGCTVLWLVRQGLAAGSLTAGGGGSGLGIGVAWALGGGFVLLCGALLMRGRRRRARRAGRREGDEVPYGEPYAPQQQYGQPYGSPYGQGPGPGPEPATPPQPWDPARPPAQEWPPPPGPPPPPTPPPPGGSYGRVEWPGHSDRPRQRPEERQPASAPPPEAEPGPQAEPEPERPVEARYGTGGAGSHPAGGPWPPEQPPGAEEPTQTLPRIVGPDEAPGSTRDGAAPGEGPRSDGPREDTADPGPGARGGVPRDSRDDRGPRDSGNRAA